MSDVHDVEKTLVEKIAEKRREIETIDFIAAGCTSDEAYRGHAANRSERVSQLVELERQLEARSAPVPK